MLIAIKDKDRIVAGLTMANMYVETTENDILLDDNIPFFKVRGNKNCYVLISSACFAADLLRYNDFIFKDVTDGESVIKGVVPKMRALLEEYDQILDDKSWESNLVIIKDDKAYSVNVYFVVEEISDYCAFLDQRYIDGTMFDTQGLDPVERILTAVKTVSKTKFSQYFPLIVFDSKTKKKQIFHQ